LNRVWRLCGTRDWHERARVPDIARGLPRIQDCFRVRNIDLRDGQGLAGLHEFINWQLAFLKTVGKFVDKTEPQIERAQEFMDSWKESMEPIMQDVKRVLAKIEKPVAEGVHDIENGVMAAEKRLEGMFKHK